MKKTSFAAAILCLVALLSACHHQRNRVIRVQNDHMSLTIKYVGTVRFNEDGTAIKSISPNGSVSYQKDDKDLYAENDGHGGIRYELHDGSSSMIDETERKNFIATTVQEMISMNDEHRRR